jgi:hypothetical protein
MGDRRGAYRALVGDLRERYRLKDLGIDGRVVLKWIILKLSIPCIFLDQYIQFIVLTKCTLLVTCEC